MKKFFLFTLILSSAIFLPRPGLAAEKINSFDLEFKINSDGSVEITEKILYDFDTLQRHGIFRDIPYKYKARGGNFELRISDVSVTDENGRSYNFSKTSSGGNVSIKIGDADRYVTGQKIYIISYKVRRALNYFDDHDEFYWNAIGNGWDIPIENISAKAILPEGSESAQNECFVGYYGSQERCVYETSQNEINFSSRDLSPNEGMTIVVGFPKGTVAEPSVISNLLETLKDNWIAFIPFIVLIFMFDRWRKKGRDPKGRGTIVAQYEAPDNLTPLEAGTLVDESAHNKDVSSEIIDLAVRGYLKIIKTEDKILLFKTADYKFEKLKESDDLKNEFDREIMKGIFGSGGIGKTVKLSSLTNKFYQNLKKITDNAYDSLVSKGYFPRNPVTTKAVYLVSGLAVAFLSFLAAPFFGFIGVLSLVISGIIITAFSFIMSVKTQKGVLAREHILGLKEYMKVAEKERLKFHNAPRKNPEHFEKLLPYAMALGVYKEWAQQFKDIYQGSPEWYSDPAGTNFSSIALADSLSNFSSSADSTIISSPSSASGGGSGFSGGGSGGGGGGGGGGSW
ncbi:MAG: DUF2207 domain-containing protein [Parcubacteria group bacterium]|jgi:uncharacterized membrane protein|nr:DUF2207 domain-containing protein [Candidatus Moranbacteria bacterium]